MKQITMQDALMHVMKMYDIEATEAQVHGMRTYNDIQVSVRVLKDGMWYRASYTVNEAALSGEVELVPNS